VQMVSINDANGVERESPHVPSVTKGDRAVFVTSHVSLPQPRSTPQSKASSIKKGNCYFCSFILKKLHFLIKSMKNSRIHLKIRRNLQKKDPNKPIYFTCYKAPGQFHFLTRPRKRLSLSSLNDPLCKRRKEKQF